MAKQYTKAIALRLTPEQFNKLTKASKRLQKENKAKSREEVIRQLIDLAFN